MLAFDFRENFLQVQKNI